MNGMHYFIDGYNLMFRRLRAGTDLKTQRTYIIKELDESTSILQLDITLVFDAQYQCGIGSRSHFHCLEICFTDEGETADEYILKALKRMAKPQQETVVTSDKKLASHTRRYSAKTETVEKFMSWLTKRRQNKERQENRLQPTILIPSISRKPLLNPKYESDTERWLRIFEERFQNLNLETAVENGQ
ncbi:MAG TPA: NYN domain-containing protein [Waddliaceae bacterium]